MPRNKINKDCSVSGCLTGHYAKGLCKQHYMVANRAKFNLINDLNTPQKPEFDYDDFWQFVKKELKLG